MCFNDDAIVKCMSEKNSPFGTTLARLSSTPLPHKFETSRISGSPLACKRVVLYLQCLVLKFVLLLDYTLDYEYENDNPTTNLQFLSIMTSRKMIVKQIDFEDIFSKTSQHVLFPCILIKEMLYKKRTWKMISL